MDAGSPAIDIGSASFRSTFTLLLLTLCALVRIELPKGENYLDADREVRHGSAAAFSSRPSACSRHPLQRLPELRRRLERHRRLLAQGVVDQFRQRSR